MVKFCSGSAASLLRMLAWLVFGTVLVLAWPSRSLGEALFQSIDSCFSAGSFWRDSLIGQLHGVAAYYSGKEGDHVGRIFNPYPT